MRNTNIQTHPETKQALVSQSGFNLPPVKTFSDSLLDELEPEEPFTKINSPSIIANFFRRIWNKDLINLQEEVYAVFVTGASDFIDYRLIHRGGSSNCTVDIQLVLRYALLSKAYGVFIAHNHPNGSLAPSEQDKELTIALDKGCDVLGLKLLDHTILTDKSYYSFHEGGLL